MTEPSPHKSGPRRNTGRRLTAEQRDRERSDARPVAPTPSAGPGRVKRYGSTTPRLFTPPIFRGKPGPCSCGCALTRETSLGFSMIDFAEQIVGMQLLPWQRWLAVHAFELAADALGRPIPGKFRYRTVLILIARQNGKTTYVEIKNLWKMFVLGVPLVIGTAQKLDLAEESWTHAVDIAEGVPELAELIARVNRSNGKKSLDLLSGSRWKIEPATRGGGRGLSGDDVNLDELREHQKWDSWGAVTKTTLARGNAQIWAFTNAGDDKSVVLNTVQGQMRAAAKALVELLAAAPHLTTAAFQRAAEDDGVDTSVFLAEWSVPDDVKCTCLRTGNHPHKATCQLQDRDLWAMANPSMGHTISEAALASALATDPEAIFRTECLCQRVPDLVKAQLDAEQWAKLADPESRPGLDNLVLAVDVAPQRDYATIAGYSIRPDGIGHAELIDYRPGTSWIADRLAVLKKRYNPVAITLDARSPAGSLLDELKKVGIEVAKTFWVDGDEWDYDRDEKKQVEQWTRGGLYIPSTQEVAAGAGQLVDRVNQAAMRHTGQQPNLDQAVAGVKPRPLGDAWAWARRIATVDISPVCGITLAQYAHARLADKIVPDDDYDILSSVY